MATSIPINFSADPSWRLPERQSNPNSSQNFRLRKSYSGSRFSCGENRVTITRLRESRGLWPGCLIKCSAEKRDNEPLLLRFAVSGATELLRAFSGGKNGKIISPRPPETRFESADAPGDFVVVSSADLVEAIRSDFARSYFLTGEVSTSLYSENCFYKDPTVGFSGRDLYKRNLKLLVPFYEDPSLILDSIHEDFVGDESRTVILANWRLRVYLKLPWKPFIAVDGLTTYCWDKSVNKIVSHVESWNITGLQAMGQLFTPSDRAFWRNRRGVAKQE